MSEVQNDSKNTEKENDDDQNFILPKYARKKNRRRQKERDALMNSCTGIPEPNKSNGREAAYVVEVLEKLRDRVVNPRVVTLPQIELKGNLDKQNAEAKIVWSSDKITNPVMLWQLVNNRPMCVSSDEGSNSVLTARIEYRRKGEPKVAGGANGIFTRRLDFSSFNTLPKLKLNSYQIKTEDEGNHGNDDTRCFILSTLASHNRSKVQCVLCGEYLLVFDRYPLVDGTFFLSPRQHAKFCIEVKVEGRTQFLTCVCMGCLEGNIGRQVFCRFCNTRWDGSSLVLGTMYSYDIFAAMPCCTERIKCNSCFKPVLHPAQRLNYFSDYSHMVPCPHCRTLDTHFVKSLTYCFVQRNPRPFSQWP